MSKSQSLTPKSLIRLRLQHLYKNVDKNTNLVITGAPGMFAKKAKDGNVIYVYERNYHLFGTGKAIDKVITAYMDTYLKETPLFINTYMARADRFYTPGNITNRMKSAFDQEVLAYKQYKLIKKPKVERFLLEALPEIKQKYTRDKKVEPKSPRAAKGKEATALDIERKLRALKTYKTDKYLKVTRAKKTGKLSLRTSDPAEPTRSKFRIVQIGGLGELGADKSTKQGQFLFDKVVDTLQKGEKITVDQALRAKAEFKKGVVSGVIPRVSGQPPQAPLGRIGPAQSFPLLSERVVTQVPPTTPTIEQQRQQLAQQLAQQRQQAKQRLQQERLQLAQQQQQQERLQQQPEQQRLQLSQQRQLTPTEKSIEELKSYTPLQGEQQGQQPSVVIPGEVQRQQQLTPEQQQLLQQLPLPPPPTFTTKLG